MGHHGSATGPRCFTARPFKREKIPNKLVGATVIPLVQCRSISTQPKQLSQPGDLSGSLGPAAYYGPSSRLRYCVCSSESPRRNPAHDVAQGWPSTTTENESCLLARLGGGCPRCHFLWVAFWEAWLPCQLNASMRALEYLCIRGAPVRGRARFGWASC